MGEGEAGGECRGVHEWKHVPAAPAAVAAGAVVGCGDDENGVANACDGDASMTVA